MIKCCDKHGVDIRHAWLDLGEFIYLYVITLLKHFIINLKNRGFHG